MKTEPVFFCCCFFLNTLTAGPCGQCGQHGLWFAVISVSFIRLHHIFGARVRIRTGDRLAGETAHVLLSYLSVYPYYIM